jgi:hypothetical protein
VYRELYSTFLKRFTYSFTQAVHLQFHSSGSLTVSLKFHSIFTHIFIHNSTQRFQLLSHISASHYQLLSHISASHYQLLSHISASHYQLLVHTHNNTQCHKVTSDKMSHMTKRQFWQMTSLDDVWQRYIIVNFKW